MKIKRLNDSDIRFDEKIVNQHGAYLVDDIPVSFRIINKDTAIIDCDTELNLEEVINEFRFYSGHVSRFIDHSNKVIKEYPTTKFISIKISDINVSQFYISEDKLQKITTWVNNKEDICIPVMKYNNSYISIDGHTRLKAAQLLGIEEVYVYEENSSDYIYDFVEEARKRGILTVYEMLILSKEEYQNKWHNFCDNYFAKK